jgi:hypothetical protein
MNIIIVNELWTLINFSENLYLRIFWIYVHGVSELFVPSL